MRGSSSNVRHRATIALALVLAGGSAACSLLVESRTEQCVVDGDCAQFNGANAHCDTAQHVCVAGAPCAQENGSCFCNPTTNDELLNACTDIPCVSFDESRLTSLVDGAPPNLPNKIRPFKETPYIAPIVGLKCSSLPGTKVYIIGPASVQPFLTVLGAYLKGQGITPVYQDISSCDAIAAIATTPVSPLTKEGGAVYFDGTDKDGEGILCDITADAQGHFPLPDIASSETFAESCFQNFNGYPKGVTEVQGPVIGLAFVAPSATKQSIVNRDAAYLIYGFGAKSGASPWTDIDFIFERDPSSGTQNVIAQTIGVPANQWLGQRTTGTSDEVAKIEAIKSAANANKTIGEMAANEAENERGNGLVELAYQHTNQLCAYYPDSAPDKSDKQNLRDGHYALWGPLHLIYDKSRDVSDVEKILNLITGETLDPTIDLVSAAAQAHVVPQCAMHVQRVSGDGTAMSPFTPPNPCSCKYDELTGGDLTGCHTCTTNEECASMLGSTKCSFNYCEP